MPEQSTTKLLFLGSSPADLASVAVTRELEAIVHRLRETKHGAEFEIRPHFQVVAENLPRLLMRTEPQIVHFCGHGSEMGELLFQRSDGNAMAIQPDFIAEIFGILGDGIRCVFLNACYSEPQAELIAQHVDVVIGLSGGITETAAIEFAAGFYEALGYGRSALTAFELGVARVKLGGHQGSEFVTMKVRTGVDPGQVFLKGPRVPTTGPRGESIVWHLVLDGSLEQLNEGHGELLGQLRQLTGDRSLTITQLSSGSILIEVLGTREGMERLRVRVADGGLEIWGFEVAEVRLGPAPRPTFATPTQRAETDTDAQSWRLVALHFSDLHFGEHSRFAKWDPDKLGRRFADEVRKGLREAKLEAVDLVLVTGDVTEGARKAEFEQASVFFSALAKALGVERDRYCFAPGNHDVSWALCQRARAEQDYEGFNDAVLTRRIQTEKGKPWAAFVSQFHDSARARGRPLGHGHAHVHDFEELHLSVAVLDSCIGVTDEQHAGEIEADQAQAVMNEWRRDDREDWLKILAVHHNPVPGAETDLKTWVDWLGEQADAGELTRDQVAHFAADAVGFRGRQLVQAITEDTCAQLVVHGHVHAAGHSAWSWTRGERGQTQVVGAGSWGLENDKLPAEQLVMFQLLVLDPLEPELRIHRRVWNPRVRTTGVVEPGTFVADATVVKGGLPLDIGVPRRVRASFQVREEAPAASAIESEHVSMAELEHYARMAKAMHEEVPLVGFNVKARIPLMLQELHVPLDAIIDRGRRGREVYASADLAKRAKAQDDTLRQESLPLAKAFARARDLKRRGLVLLGDPGSGKTTHLKRVLLQVLTKGPESIGLPAGTTPVLLSLRGLKDVGAGLPGLMAEQLADPLLKLPADFGKRLCKRGTLLLLLDGLDEVANAEQRAAVSRMIERAHASDPETFILVSSRYAGYADDVELGRRFIELHLRPLDDAQMTAFVRNWYQLVERELTVEPEQAEIKAKTKAEDLLTVLTKPEFTSVARVYEMTRNPLLLTAICLVHHDQGRLPHARAKLYQDAIAVLLDRWRRRREGKPLLEAEDALSVLRPVAYWMHGERGRRQASGDQLRKHVTEALDKLRRVELDAETFLKEIRDNAGLLTGWGVDEYGFMHLGFQEFLAAQQMRNVGTSEVEVFGPLAGRFEDSWWQEVILLMLAQRNPSVFEPFMAAIVERPQFATGWNSEMMQLCLREAGEPTATPFLNLLDSTKEEEDLAERQLAAAKLLKREGLVSEDVLSERVAGHSNAALQRWWSGRSSVSVIHAPRGGVELVRIPAGRFMMGTPSGHHDDERPCREVELAEFYLARTPVTNAQFARYLEANPDVEKPGYWGDRRFNQPEQPVVGVSWWEAQAYCEWAGLVLPTEAQWEYACRAGTQTNYWSGDTEEDLARVGWYSRNSEDRLHAVAELSASPWGLHDMHGNVFEWCRDGWADYTVDPRGDDGLRKNPEGDDHRVIRGGSFVIGADYCRSAYRLLIHPDCRGDFVGFRPAQGRA